MQAAFISDGRFSPVSLTATVSEPTQHYGAAMALSPVASALSLSLWLARFPGAFSLSPWLSGRPTVRPSVLRPLPRSFDPFELSLSLSSTPCPSLSAHAACFSPSLPHSLALRASPRVRLSCLARLDPGLVPHERRALISQSLVETRPSAEATDM